MKRMESLRGRLGERRRELLRQVGHAEDDLRALDTNVSSELEEEAQEAVIASYLEQLDARGQAEIDAIDHALAQMDSGDYGTCEDCEEPIPIERLEALPTAVTCILCAERREAAARMRVAS